MNPNVEVCIKVEDLIKTHFGVFGFTGSGKSNLMSTLVSRLLSVKGLGIKVVLFDLMSEYHPLLADLLHNLDTAYILSLDVDSLPGGEDTAYYLGSGKEAGTAAAAMARTMLLPTELVSVKAKYTTCFRHILEAGKVRVLDVASEPPSSREVFEVLRGCIAGNIGTAERPIELWIRDNENSSDQTIGFEQLKRWADELQGYASMCYWFAKDPNAFLFRNHTCSPRTRASVKFCPIFRLAPSQS